MKKISILTVCIFIFCIFVTKVEAKVEKYALIIGNGDYKSSPLKNTKNDATDIAKTLKEKGFKVQRVINANHRKMITAIRKFGNKLYKGGIGLFYYAGHGVQVRGRNYLVPINADIQDEDDVEFNAVDAGFILSKMESANNTMNIIILDACRDNPFARSFRSASRGLAKMDAPRGSIIIYATSPGSIAADGEGRNGVFTKHLLRLMNKPNLEIAALLREVRRQVLKETGGRQLPWESSSLMSDFYFTEGVDTSIPVNVSEVKKKIVLPPGEVKIDFTSIETEKKWRSWEKSFKDSVDKAKLYENDPNVSRKSKKDMWITISKGFISDNPFSGEDEKLRSYVNERVKYFNSPLGTGLIEFSAFPYAELIIDGKSYGEIPPVQKIELTEGKHLIIFKKGLKQKIREIIVKKNRTDFYYHNFK